MLTAEQVTAIEALGKKYPGHYMAKFTVDPGHWVREAELLHRGLEPVGDVLDIGCGFGYFLSQCQPVAIGVDIGDAIIQDASDVLNVPVAPYAIRPYSSLQIATGLYYFDTVTMFGCTLRHHHPSEPGGYWGWDEYRFFIRDVLSHLRNGGRFVIRPNVMLDPKPHHADLLDADALDHAVGDFAKIAGFVKGQIILQARAT